MAIAFSENYKDFLDIIKFQNGEKTCVKKAIVIYNALFFHVHGLTGPSLNTGKRRRTRFTSWRKRIKVHDFHPGLKFSKSFFFTDGRKATKRTFRKIGSSFPHFYRIPSRSFFILTISLIACKLLKEIS